MRCPDPCGKVLYDVETTAQLACVKMALGGDDSMSWYYSQACGGWHLTSGTKRGKTGRRSQWVKGFKPEASCSHVQPSSQPGVKRLEPASSGLLHSVQSHPERDDIDC